MVGWFRNPGNSAVDMVNNAIIFRVLYIPAGAGFFFASTVVW